MCWRKIQLLVGLVAWVVALPGCKSLLPSSQASETRFKSFEEARDAFDAIVPGQTTVAELEALKIDPGQQGIDILPYIDVARFFLPHSGASFELHDPAVLACMKARDRCGVWRVWAERSKGRRTSNLVLDVLRFHRKKKVQGFLFQGVVLVIDDKAIYRLYAGRPHLRYIEQEVQPLGFLQKGPKVELLPLGDGGLSLVFGDQSIGTLQDRPLNGVAPIEGLIEGRNVGRDQQNSGESVREGLDE